MMLNFYRITFISFNRVNFIDVPGTYIIYKYMRFTIIYVYVNEENNLFLGILTHMLYAFQIIYEVL